MQISITLVKSKDYTVIQLDVTTSYHLILNILPVLAFAKHAPWKELELSETKHWGNIISYSQ